jgi:hypothetical protein
MQVIQLSRLLKWQRVMGYRAPEAESAPQFFLRTYPQAYPQAGQGVGVRADRRQPTPPVAKSDRGSMYTPQQKIFAKVKAALCL